MAEGSEDGEEGVSIVAPMDAEDAKCAEARAGRGAQQVPVRGEVAECDLDPQSLGLVCDLLDGCDLLEVLRVSRLWRAAALDVGVSFWRELDADAYGLMAPYEAGESGRKRGASQGRMCFCQVRRVLSGRRALHLRTLDLRMCGTCDAAKERLLELVGSDAVDGGEGMDVRLAHLNEDVGLGCCLGAVSRDPEAELGAHMDAMGRGGGRGDARVPLGIAIAGCLQLENLCVDGCTFPFGRGGRPRTGLYLSPLQMLTTVNLSRTQLGDVELLMAFGHKLVEAGEELSIDAGMNRVGSDEDSDSEDSGASALSDMDSSDEDGEVGEEEQDASARAAKERARRPVLEAGGEPLPCLKYLNLAHSDITGRFVRVNGRDRMSLEVLLGDCAPALEELVLSGNPVALEGSRWSRHGARMHRVISARDVPLRVNMLDELKLPASLKLYCGYCHQALFENVTGYLKRMGSQAHIAVEIHTDHRPSESCASYLAAAVPGDTSESAQTLNCAGNCHDRMDLYLVDCGTGAVDLWGYSAGVACSESVCLGGKNPRMKFFRLWRCPNCGKENQTAHTSCLNCNTDGPALTLALGETGNGKPTVRRWVFDAAQPHMFVADGAGTEGAAAADTAS